MPYPKEHAARIRDPGLFIPTSFRSKDITTGIRIIVGKLKGDQSMIVQAYRFSVDNFTEEEAKKWLEDHKVKYMKFEPASEEELKHIGVIGMRWGHRKSSSDIARDNAKKLKKAQDSWDKKHNNLRINLEAYNRAADHANKVLIPRINKKYGKYDWSKIDTTNPYNPKGDKRLVEAYRKYINEYERSFKRVFDMKMTDLIGERPK